MAGYLSLVLHAHLPYVLSHGRWPQGADWLNEAVAETYLPLLNNISDLVHEGIVPHLAIDISPVLAEQLASAEFKREFRGYLLHRIAAADEDRAEFLQTGDEVSAVQAGVWHEFYSEALTDFRDRHRENLIAVFRDLQDAGAIEILTCAATHGYLPLLKTEGSIQGQIRIAVETHEKHFGRPPRGIWLPECAYRPAYRWSAPGSFADPALRPGLDEFLSDAGIDYFFVDTHVLRGGKPIGNYLARYSGLRRFREKFERQYPAEELPERSPLRPYLVATNPTKKPVAFFTREPTTATQVWPDDTGYPGDDLYLEFHKRKFPSGLRYWRVTDRKADLGGKQPYQPEATEDRIREHARHFVGLAQAALATAQGSGFGDREQESGIGDRGSGIGPNPDARPPTPGAPPSTPAPTPIVCALYDAELFGHWWFEGPRWIAEVYRTLNSAGNPQDQEPVENAKCQMPNGKCPDLRSPPPDTTAALLTPVPITPGAYLDEHYPTEIVALPEGSWGEGGFHTIWLNMQTRWTWESLYVAEDEFQRAMRTIAGHPACDRVLRQIARELLLLESSDWQFFISAQNTRGYAEKRFREHEARFRQLMALGHKLRAGRGLSQREAGYLAECERTDNVFPNLDWRILDSAFWT